MGTNYEKVDLIFDDESNSCSKQIKGFTGVTSLIVDDLGWGKVMLNIFDKNRYSFTSLYFPSLELLNDFTSFVFNVVFVKPNNED